MIGTKSTVEMIHRVFAALIDGAYVIRDRSHRSPARGTTLSRLSLPGRYYWFPGFKREFASVFLGCSQCEVLPFEGKSTE
jgi:hypothetical protein